MQEVPFNFEHLDGESFEMLKEQQRLLHELQHIIFSAPIWDIQSHGSLVSCMLSSVEDWQVL